MVECTPYVIDLQEETIDFYTNVRNSLKGPVANKFSKTVKSKDSLSDIIENTTVKFLNLPQILMFKSTLKEEGDWRFKCIPNEFDVRRIYDKEEEKEDINPDLPDSEFEYEITNIVTFNKTNDFFEMINKDAGEWGGWAQGNWFDENKFFSLDYKWPEKGKPVVWNIYPEYDVTAPNDPNTVMNYFFVELNPCFVIYMKKGTFEIDKDKFISKDILINLLAKEEDHYMNFDNDDEKLQFEQDMEMAKKLQEEMDEKEKYIIHLAFELIIFLVNLEDQKDQVA